MPGGESGEKAAGVATIHTHSCGRSV